MHRPSLASKAVATAVVLGSTLIAGGCGDSKTADTAGVPVINEVAGTYRGLGIGDARKAVVARLGQPATGGGPAAPTAAIQNTESGARAEDHGAPAYGCGFGNPAVGGGTMRYKQVVFVLDQGRVCGWTTVEKRAATKRGVAIGDDLDEASRAYPGLRCGEASVGEESFFPLPTLQYCEGRVAPGRYVWFGSDPIDTIQMNNLKFPHSRSLP